MSQIVRRKEIARRRRRRAKITKLKAKIAKGKDAKEIGRLMEKIKTISPNYPFQTAK